MDFTLVILQSAVKLNSDMLSSCAQQDTSLGQFQWEEMIPGEKPYWVGKRQVTACCKQLILGL